MGIFGNMLNQTKELTRLANAIENVNTFLDEYEHDPDPTWLYAAAWLCKVGVVDIIEKNGWPPYYKVSVNINGKRQFIQMTEVMTVTIARLSYKTSKTNNNQLQENISNILDGGTFFYKIDKQIPSPVRKIIE